MSQPIPTHLRIKTIVAWFFIVANGLAIVPNSPEQRINHLNKAAEHLEAAGLQSQAADIRRLARSESDTLQFKLASAKRDRETIFGVMRPPRMHGLLYAIEMKHEAIGSYHLSPPAEQRELAPTSTADTNLSHLAKYMVQMTANEVAETIRALPPDVAIRILRNMDPRQVSQILPKLGDRGGSRMY